MTQFVVEPDDDDPPATGPAAPATGPAIPDLDSMLGPAATPAATSELAQAPAGDAAELAAKVAEQDEAIAKLTAAVHRNNSENARRRNIAKWMREHNIEDLDSWLTSIGVDKTTAQLIPPGMTGSEPAAPEVVEGPDLDELRGELDAHRTRADTAESRAAEFETRTTALETALREQAIAHALRTARFSGDPEKARRVMDLSKVKVSTDGVVSGVEEAVKGLRDEIPEWFAARQQRQTPPSRSGVDSGDRRPAAQRQPKWDERVASQMRGRS